MITKIMAGSKKRKEKGNVIELSGTFRNDSNPSRIQRLQSHASFRITHRISSSWSSWSSSHWRCRLLSRTFPRSYDADTRVRDLSARTTCCERCDLTRGRQHAAHTRVIISYASGVRSVVRRASLSFTV